MSDPSAGEAGSGAASAPATVELTDVEARILGALVEKSLTTPDQYPMTTNAMVNACNQKSNRDPVVSYTAVDVDGALLELRQRSLVRRVHTPGARSTKHRQTLDEALGLNRSELVLVSVLMLRGAQTLGELRTRSERQNPFESTEAVETVLIRLAERSTPIVRRLERQPGQKEARWVHLLSEDVADAPAATAASADSLAAATAASAGAGAAPVTPSASPAPVSVHTEGRDTHDGDTQGRASQDRDMQDRAVATPSAESLEERVGALELELRSLRSQLTRLASQLGEELEG